MFGRRRLVPELTSRNGQIRAGAERDAVNMPIQGTAADILKRAMIDVHARADRARGRRARMILTVHDELLFEAPTRGGRRDPPRWCASRWKARCTLNVPLDCRRRDRGELEGGEGLRLRPLPQYLGPRPSGRSRH